MLRPSAFIACCAPCTIKCPARLAVCHCMLLPLHLLPAKLQRFSEACLRVCIQGSACKEGKIAYRDIESFSPDQQHTSANHTPAVLWVVFWPDIGT